MIPNEMMNAHTVSNEILSYLNERLDLEEMKIHIMSTPWEFEVVGDLNDREVAYITNRLEDNGWKSQYAPWLRKFFVFSFDPSLIQMTIQSF